MGKYKNGTRRRADVQEGISLTPSFYAGEIVKTVDVVHDLRDEVESLEDALSQMGGSSKMSFHFMLCAGCHLNGLYHLSIDKVTQHMKIRHASASKSDFRGKRR